MGSSRRPLSKRFRPWLAPGAGLVLSLGLMLLPLPAKSGLAGVLERSVFLPYRFAVGWGPRSLMAQHRAGELLRERSRETLASDGAVEATRENDRLRDLLGFRRRSDVEMIPAVVVGRGRTRFGDLLVVESADPLAAGPGMAAITPDGLLGRVRDRDGDFARVECLTSLEMAVSVTNQRTREGGILKWDPAHGALVVSGIPTQSDWQAGDRVVTSGLGLAYPGGILVGWVSGHRTGRGGLMQSIAVRPAARPGRAQEVFLLRVTGEPAPVSAAAPRGGLSSLYPAETPSTRGVGQPPSALSRPEPGP